MYNIQLIQFLSLFYRMTLPKADYSSYSLNYLIKVYTKWTILSVFIMTVPPKYHIEKPTKSFDKDKDIKFTEIKVSSY